MLKIIIYTPSCSKMKMCMQQAYESIDMTNFIVAIKQNNIQYITNHKNKYHNVFDNRDTSYGEEIIKGFAPIHYAIYYHNFQVFQLLIKDDLHLKTKEDIQMKMVINGVERIVTLHSESNSLQLCIAIKFQRGLEHILHELNKTFSFKYKLFYGHQNSMQMTALSLACFFDSPTAQQLLKNKAFIVDEMHLNTQGKTFCVYMAMASSNIEALQTIFEVMKRSKSMIDDIMDIILLTPLYKSKQTKEIVYLKDLTETQEFGVIDKKVTDFILKQTEISVEQTDEKQLKKLYNRQLKKQAKPDTVDDAIYKANSSHSSEIE